MYAIIALISLGFLGSAFIGSDNSSSDENQESDIENDPVEELSPQEDVLMLEVVEVNDMGDAMDDELLTTAEDEAENPIDLSILGLDESVLSGRVQIIGSLQDDMLNGAQGELSASGDHLFGREGNDILVGGDGDVLIGGSGSDQFLVSEDSEVVILDFEEDEILIVRYAGQSPVITGDATDTGISILADGLLIAHIEDVYHFDFSRVVLLDSTS